MEKEEPAFKFPSNCISYLSKSTATIAEFNSSGTLLAVGGKLGIILIMDMLTSRIVKGLSYFPELDIPDWIFHNFEDFEEFDLMYLLRNLKSTKLTPLEIKSGMKPKQANIKFKDYFAHIESMQFSEDSRKLLVSYRAKDRIRKDESDTDMKTVAPIGYKTIEWDVVDGSQITISDVQHAQYIYGFEDTILSSGPIPYLINKNKEKEYIVNKTEYEKYTDALSDK